MRRAPLLAGGAGTRAAVAIACATLLAGCAAGTGGDADGVLDGVGRIPGYDFGSDITLPPELELEIPEPEGGTIGPRAEGHRLLMIGDSIMASTAKRYGNETCNALVPLGWQVAVEAEPGRFVGFGLEVLDVRLRAEGGWDAAVVFLGTNYEGNPASYRARLAEIVERLAPRPTLLLTTAEFRPAQREVNRAIRDVAAAHDHVSLLDWAAVARTKGVLTADGVHLTDKGRSVFAIAVARALDVAPFRPGECLDSRFRDDSGIRAATSTTAAPAP